MIIKHGEQLSRVIIAEKRRQKITAQKLSDRSGVSKATIDNLICRPENVPRTQTFLPLLHALGLELIIVRRDKLQCANGRDELDALELLKAQEPRVLKLEEVLNTDHDVVCEFRFGMEVSRHSPEIVKRWANDAKSYYKYGQTWRCWTSRPTDEQREKVKWDE